MTSVLAVDRDWMVDREHVSYRFAVSTPDGPHLVEQQALPDDRGRPHRVAALDVLRLPEGGLMTVPARFSLVTLGVDDVARSKAFYRSLGWETGDRHGRLRGLPHRRLRSSRSTRSPTWPATSGDERAGRPRPADPPRDQRRRRPRRSTRRVAELMAAGAALLARRRRPSGAATPRSSPTRTGTPGRSRTTRAGRWTSADGRHP